MFAIKINFLTGRYAAHSHQGYGTREWPPHPGRLFSALVAAYYEHNLGDKEREALKWIEKRGAPEMHYPEAHERETVTVYVPHYDHKKIAKEGGEEELIPQYRASSNKERTYPTVLPEGPVHFIWRAEIPDRINTALDELVNSVPYLGESSSLVHAQLELDPPEPNFIPADNRPADENLRVAGPGRLRELEQAYDEGRRPPPAGRVGYTSTLPEQSDIAASDFGAEKNLLVLRIVDGPKPPLQVAYDLTVAVRRAILAIVDDPVPPWISGHTEDGKPAERIHVAFIPLANIGHRWADGSVLGLGLSVPEDVSARKKRTLYQAIDQLNAVSVGSRGEVELKRVANPTKESLKRDPYTRESTLWTTVTPYVYDRYPGSNEERDEMIARACEHIGLPQPEEVHVIESDVSPLTGVPNDRDTQLANTRFSDRPRQHLVLQFSNPVRGPVIIGKGRFVGIGLMRSLKRGE